MKSTNLSSLFTVCILFAGTFVSCDQARPVKPGLSAPPFNDCSEFDDKAIEQIDQWLLEQLAMGRFPSLSVAIVSNGTIVYQRALNSGEIETSNHTTPETAFHVASVTKVFTTTLAVLLHEQGVVDLDRPVISYLPGGTVISNTPKQGATITLRQLASHTSGLPRRVPGQVQTVEGRYQLEPDRLYEHLAKVRLEFAPGTDHTYSNLGFGLLGHVLECAAGKPFDQLLSELVSAPLQLQHTSINPTPNQALAAGYSETTPRRTESHSFQKRLAGSGGLIASAPDLARFLAAQMEPGRFSSGVLAQLHTAAALADGSKIDRALGWSLRDRPSTGMILKKNGGRNNCSAWIGFAPEHKTGVAVVTNCGEPGVDPIGYWLLERAVPGGLKLVTQLGYAKVAPWTGFRWNNDQPFIQLPEQSEWVALAAINQIPIEEIIEFAITEFEGKARKRIAEDLVEVLTKMGHQPDWQVVLTLEMENGQTQDIEVRMTGKNRAAVWRRGQ